jgi:hypothetical protein
VWVMNPSQAGNNGLQPPPKAALDRLHQYSRLLVSHLSLDDPRRPVVSQAMDNLWVHDEPANDHYYQAANNKVRIALAIYSLRPNPRMQRQINDIRLDVLPARQFLDPERSLGLPIRASDKCLRESECLSFEQYMKGVSDFWHLYQKESGGSDNNANHNNPIIVFSTESQEMVQNQTDFVANVRLQRQFDPLNFTFVRNTQDVTPDSGWVKDFYHHKKQNHKKSNNTAFTADDNMLSVLSTLKMQLLPRLSMGNCCSSFHLIMNELLNGGLGAATDNHFKCMQDFEDPSLRMCCWGDKRCWSRWQNDKQLKQK